MPIALSLKGDAVFLLGYFLRFGARQIRVNFMFGCVSIGLCWYAVVVDWEGEKCMFRDGDFLNVGEKMQAINVNFGSQQKCFSNELISFLGGKIHVHA